MSNNQIPPTDLQIIDLARGYSHAIGNKRVFLDDDWLVKFTRALLAANQPVQAAQASQGEKNG